LIEALFSRRWKEKIKLLQKKDVENLKQNSAKIAIVECLNFFCKDNSCKEKFKKVVEIVSFVYRISTTFF
jgi:hypothetical protein